MRRPIPQKRLLLLLCLLGGGIIYGCNKFLFLSNDDDDVVRAKVLNEEEGSTTAAVAAGSTSTQSINADNGDGTSASASFPPGSLQIDAAVTVARADTLVTPDAAAALEDSTAASGGTPVAVVSSEPQDAINPFAINLPSTPIATAPATGLKLDEQTRYVAYVVTKQDQGGNSYIGVLPPDQFTETADGVQVTTRYFGIYQAIYLTRSITETIEMEVVDNVIQPDFSGEWQLSCGGPRDFGYYSVGLTFTDTAFTRTLQVYTDADCTTASGSAEELTGTWSTGSAVEGLTATVAVTFTSGEGTTEEIVRGTTSSLTFGNDAILGSRVSASAPETLSEFSFRRP